MAGRTKKELDQLRAEYKKHVFDPAVRENGGTTEGMVSLKEGFDEFVRTLDTVPNSVPSWRAPGA